MNSEEMGRRNFLTAATGAAAFTILKPQVVRGMQANSAVRVGLLGCGGRGTTHLETILKNTDARVTVLADMFQDRLDKAKQKVNELSSAKGHPGVQKTFLGPHAYQEIFDSKDIDAVVIATPPYFHVQHLEAAVAAGKHVYCEKPVAIDVPGTKRVLEVGKKAEGKVSLDVGFQIRMAPPYVELVNRIHEGALGEIASGAAYYYCPRDRAQLSGCGRARSASAELDSGSRALGRHHRGAEYPRHRHLQLGVARTSGEGHRTRRQERPQLPERYLLLAFRCGVSVSEQSGCRLQFDAIRQVPV